MLSKVDNFKPFKREHAFWLRDVYNNISRFRGRSGVSVVHGSEGIRVVETAEESGGGAPPKVADFTNAGGLLSRTQLNRIISIYNSAAAMYGVDLSVVISEAAFLFADESADRGNFRFPRLSSIPYGQAGILNRARRAALHALANAWVGARATDDLKLAKADWNYVIAAAEAAGDFSECFLEDWETQTIPGLGFLTLNNWLILQNNVDVLGPAGFDPLPGNGSYIDMSGTTAIIGQFAGAIIRSKEQFTFDSGTYTFRYVLAGDNRSNGDSTIAVRFHTVNTTHTLTTAQGATTFSHSLSGPITDYIEFEQTAVSLPDQSKGTLLLEVEICDA